MLCTALVSSSLARRSISTRQASSTPSSTPTSRLSISAPIRSARSCSDRDSALRRISSREVAMAKAYSCAKRSGTCPLTPRLSGRPEACPVRRERILSYCARGAPPQTHHGPLQAVVRGTAVTAKRSRPSHLALPHRAHARSSSAQRRALTEAAEADPSAFPAARHRSPFSSGRGNELSRGSGWLTHAPRQRRVFEVKRSGGGSLQGLP